MLLEQQLEYPRTTHHPHLSLPKSPRPAPRTFEYQFDIYLKDSNAYGNTYFSRYFEWQGVCRERWFRECIAPDFLQSAGIFVTKRAHQDYSHETFPFQTVTCRLNTFEVKLCSSYLLFTFLAGGEVVSTGYQQIVFTDHARHVQRLPEDVLGRLRLYEVIGGAPVN